MDSSQDNAAGRIFGERLAEKIPSPIPETSVPTQLSIDTESTIRNSTSDPALSRTNGQTVDGTAYSQRFALRSLPGMVPSKAGSHNSTLTIDFYSMDQVGRRD